MVTALMLLLKEKPLSAISISELTEKAGVSRMTYYRNYQSKEDIFASYLDEALADYQREARELSLDQRAYAPANLYHCFSYFEKHKEFLDSLFKSGLGHLLLTAISRYMIETWHKPENGIEHYYGLQAFAGGIHQRLGLRIHRADREGRSRVPVVSVIQGAYVDADDVAFSENPFTGDPVDNLFIHRDARAARKTTIPQKRGFGSL